MLCSMGVGVWFVSRALDPYTDSVREVKRLQKTGPRFYKATDKSTRLYGLTKQASLAITKGDSRQALASIRAGKKLDPRNPVFSYLEASALWEQGDRESAVKATDAGNSGGLLRLYVTTELSPGMWQWPEIDQIKNIGSEIVDDPDSTRAELITVLKLGHKLVWSSPPDFRRIMQGAELRRHAAERLLPMAKEEGNTRLAKLCEELIQESVQMKSAAKSKLAEDDSFRAGANAWIVSRALDENDHEFRRAARLLMREKQAEWGRDFRNHYIRIENLRNL